MSPQNAAARRNIALLLPPPINASLNRDTAPSLKKEMSWYDFWLSGSDFTKDLTFEWRYEPRWEKASSSSKLKNKNEGWIRNYKIMRWLIKRIFDKYSIFNKKHMFKIIQWQRSVNIVKEEGHLKKGPSVLIVLMSRFNICIRIYAK